MAAVPRFLVVFVLGGPGAGKSTQCRSLVETFGYVHLSAGDLLRLEMNSGSEHGQLIRDMIEHGQIVPSHITVALLRQAMERSAAKKFLIDGFPRNAENNEAWKREMGASVRVPYLLHFDCPEEVMEQRLLSRAASSGRHDDNIESIRKRFTTFQEQTQPVIREYEQSGETNVVTIHAARSVDDVRAQLHDLFSRMEQ